MEDCRACAWDGYCIPDECIGIQKSAGTCANRIPAKKKKYSNNSISQKTSDHHGLHEFHTI